MNDEFVTERQRLDNRQLWVDHWAKFEHYMWEGFLVVSLSDEWLDYLAKFVLGVEDA